MKTCTIGLMILVLLGTLLSGQQNNPRLAILPFTGGSGDEGETIAEIFSFEGAIAEVFTIIPRTNSIEAIMKEQQFQRSAGLTDSDTIARLGHQYNADYVVAGHIKTLGTSKLVLITIIQVETLQQIAGDYREYKTIEEVLGFIPDMANRIAEAARRDPSRLPKLAVLPFALSAPGVDQGDAEVLAQLLATVMANSGKYAVLPRTSTIETVMREHQIQRSGITDTESIKLIGKALNAQYVLAGNVRRLGQVNLFTAQILHVEDARLMVGNRAEYSAVGDGLIKMAELGSKLYGQVQTAQPPVQPAPQPVPEGLAFQIVEGRSVTITKYTGKAADLVIPDRIQNLPVTAIGTAAFSGCRGLASLSLPASLTSIGDRAFYSCSGLTSLNLPASLTSIGRQSFSWCSGLRDLTVNGQNPRYTSVEGVLFDKNKQTLIGYPGGKKGAYTIPSSVTSLEAGAFWGCGGLTRLIIPASLSSLEGFAFMGCEGLASVTLSRNTRLGDSVFPQGTQFTYQE